MKKYPFRKQLLTALFCCLMPAASVLAAPLVIAQQGIFSAGGTVLTSPGTFRPEDQWERRGAGQTAHVDHANVLYQIPQKKAGAPLVFLHGCGQSRMGWMTTPDGREGWSDYFLCRGHAVFLIDEPHRGEAGSTSIPGTISSRTLEQRWYTQFRIGRWENGRSVPYRGSQFPNDAASLDQFFRQMTPDTGMKSDMGADFALDIVAKATAAVMDKTYQRTGRDGFLLTHSQGGIPGWEAARYTDHLAGIVAIEPGHAPEAGSEAYKALLRKKIPVIIYFGDYIDNGDPAIPATQSWKNMRQSSRDFARAYTKDGGSAEVVDLPAIGIHGNDHFLFQDKNSDEIAGLAEKWLVRNTKSRIPSRIRK